MEIPYFQPREVNCAKWLSGALEALNAPFSHKILRIGALRRPNAPKYGKNLMIGAFEALSAPGMVARRSWARSS